MSQTPTNLIASPHELASCVVHDVSAVHVAKQVPSYAGLRHDVLRHAGTGKRVLDVGCNEGALARELKRRDSDCRVWGIDINPTALQRAEDVLERGFQLNLDDCDRLQQQLDGLAFDTIIAADVLEHTIDPWKVLTCLVERLAPGGHVLLSLPNFGHWESIWHLIRQRFPRRSRGLYDDTHLRFFMKGNLRELEPPSFRGRVVQRNFRLWEGRQTPADVAVRYSVGLVPWLREYFVFQYLIRLERVRK